MAIRKKPDFEHMTITEVAELSDHYRYKYRLWLEAKEKRKENQNLFNEYFEKSCDEYRNK